MPKITDFTQDISPTVDDLIVTVNDPGGSPANRKVSLDNLLTALQISRLLGYVSYNPATPADVTTTSTTGADVDATNLTVTFTVPASGKVLIRLTAIAYTNTLNGMWWCLRTTGGANVSGTRARVTGQSGYGASYSISAVVTGLTPGASITYRWGMGTNTGGTAHIMYGDDGGVNPTGPAIMEVWSVP